MQTLPVTKIRSLGEGGFGTTELVEREGKRYVLKRLKQSAIASHGNTAINLFVQESEYLKVLGEHPQIPALIDSGTDSEGPWILQEYIPGENLEQILTRQHTFSEPEVIKLLQALLPTIQFIHEQGAIHRDIKPANIIWDEGQYYLVDFGASKKVSETVLAKTGTMIGSAAYASREQTMGKAVFSSDIYSLGVTCLHLLTGQNPFELMDTGTGQWQWRLFLSNGKQDTADLPPAVSEATALDRIDRRTIARQRVANIAKVRRDRAIVRWGKRITKLAITGACLYGLGIGVSKIPSLFPPKTVQPAIVQSDQATDELYSVLAPLLGEDTGVAQRSIKIMSFLMILAGLFAGGYVCFLVIQGDLIYMSPSMVFIPIFLVSMGFFLPQIFIFVLAV
jgi:serine/threonine protein kinase